MRSDKYDLIALAVLALALAGANLFWTSHSVNANQAAQQRAGVVLERKLCQTFGELAANKPPAGDPVTNPSRAYEQRNHVILDQLGADLGCTTGATP